MKYYSELTKQLYDREEDLCKAETAIKLAQAKKEAEEKAKKNERAKRAKEVEDALKAATEAQTKATKLLKDFTKDYGHFHMSYTNNPTTSKEGEVNTSDFFDLLFNFLK